MIININIIVNITTLHEINQTSHEIPPSYNKTATATAAAPNGTPVAIALIPTTPALPVGVCVAAGAVKLASPPVTVKV
jgi:hypothetical protein